MPACAARPPAAGTPAAPTGPCPPPWVPMHDKSTHNARSCLPMCRKAFPALNSCPLCVRPHQLMMRSAFHFLADPASGCACLGSAACIALRGLQQHEATVSVWNCQPREDPPSLLCPASLPSTLRSRALPPGLLPCIMLCPLAAACKVTLDLVLATDMHPLHVQPRNRHHLFQNPFKLSLACKLPQACEVSLPAQSCLGEPGFRVEN